MASKRRNIFLGQKAGDDGNRYVQFAILLRFVGLGFEDLQMIRRINGRELADLYLGLIYQLGRGPVNEVYLSSVSLGVLATELAVQATVRPSQPPLAYIYLTYTLLAVTIQQAVLGGAVLALLHCAMWHPPYWKQPARLWVITVEQEAGDDGKSFMIEFGLLRNLLHHRSKLLSGNKLTIYNVVLKPTRTYGIELSGSARKSIIDRIQSFQSKTLRTILDAPRADIGDATHATTVVIDELEVRDDKPPTLYLHRLY
ncbi:hypothetical protein AAG570_004932 [Ranatra chinensis]|uniref:Uncharacterized protein n=1 Tax=Ranatra chinensis TaxID=642074 RepID=A0ABD0YKR8_9HEMI